MRLVVLLFISAFTVLTIFTYAFVDLNLSFLSFLYTGLYLNERTFLSITYAILVTILFACFYVFISYSEILDKWFIKLTFTVFLIALFSYPAALSFDIFNYITTARVAFFYGENPYIIYPVEFVGDPYLAFTRAANKTALYGPFWIALSAIPHFAGLGNFILTLFSFKIFIGLFYLATILLIKKIDQKAVLFFALNPLVLIETLISSHNDIVMIFFSLLSIHLFLKKRYLSSVISIVLSILVKFATVFLLPVFVGMIKDHIIGQKINREKAFRYSAILMFIIFALTPLREELYPWYAIWFILFTSFLYKNVFLQRIILLFSLGLMLRYIPYMTTGDYYGFTPAVRNVLMVLPVFLFLIYTWVKKYIRFY